MTDTGVGLLIAVVVWVAMAAQRRRPPSVEARLREAEFRALSAEVDALALRVARIERAAAERATARELRAARRAGDDGHPAGDPTGGNGGASRRRSGVDRPA